MSSRRARRAPVLPVSLLALAAAALAPASAGAAYAPELDVRVEPATPSSAPAITTTVTQDASEAASRTVVVAFPAGFTAPTTKLAVRACTAQEQAARACDAASRVGSAQATAALLGLLPVDLAGSVHYGGPDGNAVKLVVYLDNAALDQHVTVVGRITIRPSDAGFDATFDDLPNLTTTRFTLALEGGDKALAATPRRCGEYVFTGAFRGHDGSTATSRSAVTIAGCPKVRPAISPLELSAERVRPGTGVRLGFSLSEPARVRVRVTGGPRNRRRLDRTFDGVAGDNVVRRFGRTFPVGRYRITVTATDADGMTARRRGSFRVVPRPRR